MMWSEGEVLQLQCPHMIYLVQQQQQEWQTWCSQLSPTLSRAGITQSDLLSALTIVRSRTFAAPFIPWPLSSFVPAAAALQVAAAVAAAASGVVVGVGVEVLGLLGLAAAVGSSWKRAQEEEQHAVCPLIDMFNHDSRVESVCELDLWSGNLKVASSQGWSAGQQVFINYGSSSNDALLQLYGFVEENNSDDRYVLQGVGDRLRQLQLAASESPSNRLKQEDTPALLEVELYSTGLPTTSAEALNRCLHATPASSSGNSSSTSSSSLIKYSALSSVTRSAVAALVKQELQQLGSSMEADEQLLRDLLQLPLAQGELLQSQQQLHKQQEQVLILRIALQQLLREEEEQLHQQELEGGEGHGEEKGVMLAMARAPVDASLGGASDAAAATASDSEVAHGGKDENVMALAAAAASSAAVSQVYAKPMFDSADGGPSEMVAAQELIARAEHEVAEMQQRQGELQVQVERLQGRVQGVKEVALRYRLLKKQLLQHVLNKTVVA